MSASDYLVDVAGRRSIFIQRYSKSLESDEKKKLSELFDSVIELLYSKNLAGLSFSQKSALELEVKEFISDHFADFENRIIQNLIDFSIEEAEFTAEMLGSAVSQTVSIPTPSEIEQYARMGRFGFGRRLSIVESLSAFGDKKSYDVTQAINDGVIEGETSQKIGRRVAQLLPLQKNQVESLVRTGVNQSSTSARLRTLETNKRLFDGYQWVATLDSRTSLICMSRDGVIFKFLPSSPLPPAHWGCRSTIVPKIKAQFLIYGLDGFRPAVGSSGVETVSAKTTYSGWLRRQPASFQDEVLGKGKAKLFRSGGLSLSHFLDDSGSEYTLEQLRSLRPLAFERANLN